MVYCATCMRILAEYPTSSPETYAAAQALSYDHWDSYSRGHMVTLTGVNDRRVEAIQGTNKFQDMSLNG